MGWTLIKDRYPEKIMTPVFIAMLLQNKKIVYGIGMAPPKQEDDWHVFNLVEQDKSLRVKKEYIYSWMPIPALENDKREYHFDITEIPPSRIYKYTSLEVGQLIISNCTLRFRRPSHFNDPFDTLTEGLTFDESHMSTEVQLEAEKMRKIYIESGFDENSFNIPNIYKNIQQAKVDESVITCFSLDPDNLVMWGHYGDGHKGMCFEFDSSKGYESIFPTAKHTLEGSVIYNWEENWNYFEDKMKGLMKVFLCKHKDWGYEREYRYVIQSKKDEFDCSFDPSYLKSISFGVKCFTEDVSIIRELCEKNGLTHLKYYRAIRDKFSINYHELS